MEEMFSNNLFKNQENEDIFHIIEQIQVVRVSLWIEHTTMNEESVEITFAAFLIQFFIFSARYERIYC